MTRRGLAFVLAGLLLGPCPAYPWRETGHRTIARIASGHLTPAARSRLARILDVADTPDSLGDALAAASIWADEAKADGKTAGWYSVRLTLQDRKLDIPARCKDDDCAAARIRMFAEQLSQKEKNRQWSEVDALRYVVHLVGDVHQPLDTISDADLGGVCELLDPPIDGAKNLHELWDGPLVNQLSADDKALAAELETEIQNWNEGRRQRMARGNQDDWVWESHLLAEHVIYRRLHIPTEPVLFPADCRQAPSTITAFKVRVDRAYLDEMKPVVRNQLMLAGLRLAHLLNEAI